MIYRKTAAGIVYQDKEFLFVQKPHWDNWWDYPQGGVNHGESLSDTILRELSEELGSNSFGNPINTNISQKRSFSKQTLEHYEDRGNDGKEIFYFAVPYIGKKNEIVLNHELSNHKWFNAEEVLVNIYEKEKENFHNIYHFLHSRELM